MIGMGTTLFLVVGWSCVALRFAVRNRPLRTFLQSSVAHFFSFL
jgi:hypothetical protein